MQTTFRQWRDGGKTKGRRGSNCWSVEDCPPGLYQQVWFDKAGEIRKSSRIEKHLYLKEWRAEQASFFQNFHESAEDSSHVRSLFNRDRQQLHEAHKHREAHYKLSYPAHREAKGQFVTKKKIKT